MVQVPELVLKAGRQLRAIESGEGRPDTSSRAGPVRVTATRMPSLASTVLPSGPSPIASPRSSRRVRSRARTSVTAAQISDPPSTSAGVSDSASANGSPGMWTEPPSRIACQHQSATLAKSGVPGR